MKRNLKTYIFIFVIACLSFVCVIFLPIPEFGKNVMTSPLAVALIAALYKIIMDDARFQKERFLKQEDRIHALSISSHMAAVAFDKHAEFSEKYLEVMRQGLKDLWAKGPCKEAGDLARKLNDTRLDYAAWVTKDIRDSLFPFEHALTMIGVNNEFFRDMPVGKERSSMVQEVHSLFKQVMEIGENSEESKEIGVSKIIEKIQDLLGINELTQLRRQVIKGALRSLEKME